MKVGHLAFTYVDGGGWHGLPCLELVLGGQLQVSLMDVIGAMDDARETLWLKTPRMVVIDGTATHDNDPSEVLELVQVLHSKGVLVMGKSDGTVYQRWMEGLRYTVAVVRDRWLGYKVTELQYRPAAEDKLKEPPSEGDMLRHLVLTGKRGLVEITDFQYQSQYVWGVLVPKKWEYNVLLLKD